MNGEDEEEVKEGRGGEEERRRRKIEEDHEVGGIGRDAGEETRQVRKELRRG